MRTRRVVLLLLAVGLVAFLLLRKEPGSASQTARARDPVTMGADGGPALHGHVVEAPQVPEPKPWWFDREVESLDPAVTRARAEAHWWAEKPQPPYEKPDAVFSADVDLVKGRGTVRITGNGLRGYVVLFVVEGGNRALAHPFFATVRDEVVPGQGHGPVSGPLGAILVGARPLALRLLDADGRPLEGLEVEACEPEQRGWLQRKETGPDGRVRFTGFRGPEAEVSWLASSNEVASRPERGHGLVREYADGPRRLVPLATREQDLRVPRNPWVRLRVRVEGAPEQAWCPVGDVKVEDVERQDAWSGTAYSASHGLSVAPGRWRCSSHVQSAGKVSVETPDLALDSETTIDVPARVPHGQGWLEVAFHVQAAPDDPRLVCAIELRSLPGERGWSGVQAAAPHDRILVFPQPGTYEVTGAIRVGGTVRFSVPRQITVAEGERTSVVLATEPAGGVLMPATPNEFWNEDVELLERRFPLTGVVEEGRFRFVSMGNRREPTTWWMPPGRWTLVHMADDDKTEIRRVPVTVEPGKVLQLRRDAAGRLSVPP